jgi:hypothetical protein
MTNHYRRYSQYRREISFSIFFLASFEMISISTWFLWPTRQSCNHPFNIFFLLPHKHTKALLPHFYFSYFIIFSSKSISKKMFIYFQVATMLKKSFKWRLCVCVWVKEFIAAKASSELFSEFIFNLYRNEIYYVLKGLSLELKFHFLSLKIVFDWEKWRNMAEIYIKFIR